MTCIRVLVLIKHLPEIGRCGLFAGPRRITALAVCGHKEIRKAKKGKRKVEMKPLPGMAKYAPADATLSDVPEITPPAPD